LDVLPEAFILGRADVAKVAVAPLDVVEVVDVDPPP
jgi:hypothetical protein